VRVFYYFNTLEIKKLGIDSRKVFCANFKNITFISIRRHFEISARILNTAFRGFPYLGNTTGKEASEVSKCAEGPLHMPITVQYKSEAYCI